MKNSFVLVVVLLYITWDGYGQSSFLQDGKGESSLKIFDNEIAINTSNESISIQFLKRRKTLRSKITKKQLENKVGQKLYDDETLYLQNYRDVYDKTDNGELTKSIEDLKLLKDKRTLWDNGSISEKEFNEGLTDLQKDILSSEWERYKSELTRTQDNARGLVTSFSLKFTANQGVSKLFDGEGFVPQVDAGITWGLNEVPLFKDNKVILQYPYLGIAVQRSEFKLFDEMESALKDEEFIGYAVNGGYNRIGEWKGRGSNKNSVTLVGFGAKAGRFNTFDDLKKVETSITTGLNENTVLLESITSGYKGDYETYYGMNLLADAYFFPSSWDNRVGLGLYARYNAVGNAPRLNSGLGMVVTKDKKPTNVVLSLMFQFTDMFNNLEQEDSNLFNRFGVNLIAGYKL
nr:hypothetical protein [Allomuricauda sp.]